MASTQRTKGRTADSQAHIARMLRFIHHYPLATFKASNIKRDQRIYGSGIRAMDLYETRLCPFVHIISRSTERALCITFPNTQLCIHIPIRPFRTRMSSFTFGGSGK